MLGPAWADVRGSMVWMGVSLFFVACAVLCGVMHFRSVRQYHELQAIFDADHANLVAQLETWKTATAHIVEMGSNWRKTLPTVADQTEKFVWTNLMKRLKPETSVCQGESLLMGVKGKNN